MAKRLFLGIIAIVAIAAMTTAGTLALFYDSVGPTDSTFAAGTVDINGPTGRLWQIDEMAPGDSSQDPANPQTETYTVTYVGSLDAWVYMDTVLSGALTTCDGGNRLTVTLKDADNHTYSPNATHQVLKNAAGANAPMTTGQTRTFTLDYELARATGSTPDAANTCQGKTATFAMTFHAIQWAHNVHDNGTPADTTDDHPIDW